MFYSSVLADIVVVVVTVVAAAAVVDVPVRFNFLLVESIHFAAGILPNHCLTVHCYCEFNFV